MEESDVESEALSYAITEPGSGSSEPEAEGWEANTEDPYMAQLPVPFAEYSDPRACATAPVKPIDDLEMWTPACREGPERRHAQQLRGKPRNGRPPLERLREAFAAHGRADLWDGQWESEIRQRKTVEGCDNYWIHPVWTRRVRDMDRRSVDDALRLVGILPPREAKPKSESPEFVLTGSFDSGVDPEVAIWNQLEALLHSLSRRETAWVFRMPVDPVKASAPDYYDIVKHPMDFGTITARLQLRRNTPRFYNSILEFRDDMRQVFENCRLYNPAGTNVRSWGDDLSESFERAWATSGVESVWQALQDQRYEQQAAATPERTEEPWSAESPAAESPDEDASGAKEDSGAKDAVVRDLGFRVQWFIEPALWYAAGAECSSGKRPKKYGSIGRILQEGQVTHAHPGSQWGSAAPHLPSAVAWLAEAAVVDSGTDSGAEPPPRKKPRFKDTNRRPQTAPSGPNPALGPPALGPCPAASHPLHSFLAASQRGTAPLPLQDVAVRVNAYVAAEKGGAQGSSGGGGVQGHTGTAGGLGDGPDSQVQEPPQPRSSDVSEGGIQPPPEGRSPAATAPSAAGGLGTSEALINLAPGLAKPAAGAGAPGRQSSASSGGGAPAGQAAPLESTFALQVAQVAMQHAQVVAALKRAEGSQCVEATRIEQLQKELSSAWLRQGQCVGKVQQLTQQAAQLKRAHEQLIQQQASRLGGSTTP